MFKRKEPTPFYQAFVTKHKNIKKTDNPPIDVIDFMYSCYWSDMLRQWPEVNTKGVANFFNINEDDLKVELQNAVKKD